MITLSIPQFFARRAGSELRYMEFRKGLRERVYHSTLNSNNPCMKKLHQIPKRRRICMLGSQMSFPILDFPVNFINKFKTKTWGSIFRIFSFDRGHHTTKYNYICDVDGNHKANKNGSNCNDETDNNNSDEITWVSSYITIFWWVTQDTQILKLINSCLVFQTSNSNTIPKNNKKIYGRY